MAYHHNFKYQFINLYFKYSSRRRGVKEKLSFKEYRDFFEGLWIDVIEDIIYNNSVCYLPYKLGAIYCYKVKGKPKKYFSLQAYNKTGKKIWIENPYTRGRNYRYRWDKYYLDIGENQGIYKFDLYPKYWKKFVNRWVKGGKNLWEEDPARKTRPWKNESNNI